MSKLPRSELPQLAQLSDGQFVLACFSVNRWHSARDIAILYSMSDVIAWRPLDAQDYVAMAQVAARREALEGEKK